MNSELAFLALVVVVGAGSLGWGTTLARCLRDAEEAPPVPLRIAMGLAATFAIDGVLVACGAARFVPLALVIASGVVLLVVAAVRDRTVGLRRPALDPVVLGQVAAWVVVAIAALLDSGSDKQNPNDDDAAYFYLAKRMLATGSLVDPFNMRRITSYGAGEVLSALSLQVSGPGSILAIEWFGWTLLALALFASVIERRHRAATVLLFGAILVCSRPVGVWANSAPVFAGVALLLALFVLLGEVRPDARPFGRFVVVGLLLAALLALRLEFVVPAAGATVLVGACLRRPRAVAEAAGGLLLGSVGGIAGWAVALERSSATPLFPLIGGDWNGAFPWSPPGPLRPGAFARRLGDELMTDHVGVALAAAMVVAVVVWKVAADDSPSRRRAVLLAGATLGTAVEVVVQVPALLGGTLDDVGRYDAPESLACLLYAVALAWSSLERRAPAALGNPILSRLPVVPLTAALLCAVVLGTSVSSFVAALRTDWSNEPRVLRGRGFPDTWTTMAASYTAGSKLVPRGSTVLAAVDEPGLLDFSRVGFATLDLPGAASPRPGIPVLDGGPAVVAYLGSLGYDGILASSFRLDGLYERSQWQASASSGIWDYRVEARWFLAWFEDLQQLRSDPGVSVTKVPGGSIVFYRFLDRAGS